MVAILVIALALGIFLHDAALADAVSISEPSTWLVATVVFGPMLLLGIWVRWVCRRRASLSGKILHRIELHLTLFRFALLPWYAGQLAAGLLLWIRQQLGDLILVDELLAMLPTLIMLSWSWWCYYPIDRRLREVALIANLDRGQPIYPIWTRSQFLIAQLRHQVLLLLAPLAAILAWVEVASRYLLPHLPEGANWMQELVLLGGAGVIFLFAPLMIRLIFDTVPLPPGQISDRLAWMCRSHGVRVRRLLLWRTFGGMINAAVMGLVAPLRYVMISDAMLDHFPQEQVEAVMAHELAHVRKHHMLWLLAFALLATMALDSALGAMFNEQATVSTGLVIALSLAALSWITAFGWASRRIERQADAFAAAHLAREKGLNFIDAASAEVMIEALGRVAHLNHINPAARSWRHGSIRSRQLALRRLMNQPLTHHRADRQAAAVQLITALLLLILLVEQLL